MVIREYRPEDCSTLAKLFYDTVHSVNARDYTQEQLDAWATGTVDLQAWNRTFLEHDTLIMEADGKIVGFADMDRQGYLDRLYVHKEFQGRGVASALLRELERRAGQAGIVCFKTHASITAKAFFEKRGYAAEKENRVVRNGVFLTNYTMIKRML